MHKSLTASFYLGGSETRPQTLGSERLTRPQTMTSEIPLTDALKAWRSHSDDGARALLDREIYAALKRMAVVRWSGHGSPPTFQPTALVNEALAGLLDRDVDWISRSHFFALAALQMRSILVDHSRRRQTEKHGGGMAAVSLSDSDLNQSGLSIETDSDFLDLDAAISDLANEEQRAARVIELTYFGGLTAREIAEVLKVSIATVENDLAYARAWLRRRLRR
jgi:RNA polymerase sigma factor (TIGR02999 family)